MKLTHNARARRILLWCAGVSAAAVPAAALAAALWQRSTSEAARRSTPETVLIEAAGFFHELPKGDTMSSASELGVPWLFHNNAIVLKSTEEAVARFNVPRAGDYQLLVRSQGRAGSSFRVKLNGQLLPTLFGDAAPALRSAGVVHLEPGALELRLTGISPAPAVDVIALTTKSDFSDADLAPLELANDAQLLRRYTIPESSAVKFGDVNGDGKQDFVVLTRSYSAHVFDHGGQELWSYEAAAEGTTLRGEFEAPGSVWDFDQDGCAEVVHWRMGDAGKEWLVIADGKTGIIRRKIDWPTAPLPHVYNNFRSAVARLHAGYPDNLVVLTDSGGRISINAYSSELQPLWSQVEELKKDHRGHYLYPIDIDGDGIDEVLVSHLALDAAGKVLWNNVVRFPDNHDHVDSLRFVDLDADGKLEALAAQSDVGTVAYRALTGEIVWQRPADHTQQIQFGDFLAGAPAPQVVVTARTYGKRELGEPYLSGQLYWFDPQGKLLSKWPAQPLNGNPDFVKGDWRGDGKTELFWYKFHLDRQGKGTLYFAEPVYHMLDFMGSGAEQVIALNHRRGILEVYGSRSAQQGRAERTVEYRRQVANHTHY